MTHDIAPMTLEATDRAELLRLARAAVAAAAEGRTPEPVDVTGLSTALRANAGAFVTLYSGDALRGCVGTFDVSNPLGRVVQTMGVAAATRDTRFHPVAPGEVGELSISISVLTPPRPIARLDEIEPGRHGLLIARGFRRGVLLGKVAAERGWNREAFLAATCHKAGLDGDAWRTFGQRSGVDISIFEELDFGEPVA